MSNAVGNREQRTQYRSARANLVLLAADNPAAVVLITGKTKYTLHVTLIVISVTTTAAQSIDIQDSAGTPIEVAGLPASAAEGCYRWDFGEEGVPITEAANLTITTSAAGVAAYIHVEGYFLQTGVMTPAELAAS